jgi:hypothetical protein
MPEDRIQSDNDRISDTELRRANQRSVPESEGEPLGAGCAVRLLWLIAGPVALAFGAAVVARHDTSSLLTAGSVFWGAVVAMVALRYWDVTRLGGQTSSGEPATPAHLKRYSITVALTAIALFGVALFVRGLSSS